jgi:hypothetical protein
LYRKRSISRASRARIGRITAAAISPDERPLDVVESAFDDPEPDPELDPDPDPDPDELPEFPPEPELELLVDPGCELESVLEAIPPVAVDPSREELLLDREAVFEAVAETDDAVPEGSEFEDAVEGLAIVETWETVMVLPVLSVVTMIAVVTRLL